MTRGKMFEASRVWLQGFLQCSSPFTLNVIFFNEKYFLTWMFLTCKSASTE